MCTIIIKPAPKGGALVILDRDPYIKEGLRQLSEPLFYTEVEYSPNLGQNAHATRNRYLMVYLPCIIPIKYARYNFICRQKYTKIRPIVSGNGCLTERISSFVEFFLQSLIKHIPSYIKDSTHFRCQLNQLGIIPQGCTLSTLDVASHYTNIPNTEGIKAMNITLTRGRCNYPSPLDTSL